MLRQLVEALSTGAVIAAGTVIVVVVSLALMHVVRRRWPDLPTGTHNDATVGVLTVAGALYAIILGFVILDAYEGIAEADTSVRAEASHLTQILEDTRSLPGLSDRVQTDIAGYVNHVVNEEWPEMRAGEEPELHEAHLLDLFTAFQEYTPRTDAEAIFFAEAYGRLNDVIEARRDRLAAAAHEMPDALRGVLIGGALLILLLTIVFAVHSRPIHFLLVGGQAVLLTASVLLALALDFPFSGDFRVTDESFRTGVLADLIAP